VFLSGSPDSRPAPQIRRAVEFTEAALLISENRVGSRQAIGLEGGNAGKAVEEGLEALHHHRAPEVITMEP